MAQDKRNLHLRLQEYCDCYMETEPKEQLESVSKYGAASDVTEDPEEVALKFVGLAILYGIKENAKMFSLVKSNEGDIHFNVDAAGSYKLPAPTPQLTDQVFSVMRSITHLETDKAEEPLSLGLRNDRIELGVAFDKTGEKQSLTVSFPRL